MRKTSAGACFTTAFVPEKKKLHKEKQADMLLPVSRAFLESPPRSREYRCRNFIVIFQLIKKKR